jgi:hypothetical protein
MRKTALALFARRKKRDAMDAVLSSRLAPLTWKSALGGAFICSSPIIPVTV